MLGVAHCDLFILAPGRSRVAFNSPAHCISGFPTAMSYLDQPDDNTTNHRVAGPMRSTTTAGSTPQNGKPFPKKMVVAFHQRDAEAESRRMGTAASAYPNRTNNTATTMPTSKKSTHVKIPLTVLEPHPATEDDLSNFGELSALVEPSCKHARFDVVDMGNDIENGLTPEERMANAEMVSRAMSKCMCNAVVVVIGFLVVWAVGYLVFTDPTQLTVSWW